MQGRRPSSSLRGSAERLRASWDTLLTLALAELRDRYGRGRWRFVKWLVDPYAATGIFLVFIVFVLDRGGQYPGLTVACAIVPFQLFLSTIFTSMQLAERRAGLILNLDFRRQLLPAAVTFTETIGFAVSLTLLPLMMAYYGIAPTVAVAWLPVAIALSILLALAASYPATLFGLWFRDLIPFALSAVRVLLFLAPGVVALAEITGTAQDWLKLNPLTGVFEAYRDALMYGQAPAAWQVLYPAAFAALALFAFSHLFRSEQRHLAKVVG